MNSVRRAEARDIPAIMDLLVQVNMVHHNGRPDLFNGPTTKYTEAELEALLGDDDTPVFVCVGESDRVLGHGFCAMQHAGGRLMVTHDTLLHRRHLRGRKRARPRCRPRAVRSYPCLRPREGLL